MILVLAMGLFTLLALAVVFVPLGIALRSHRHAQREWNRLLAADDFDAPATVHLEVERVYANR